MPSFRRLFLALALLGIAIAVTGNDAARAQDGDGETAEDAALAVAEAHDRANASVDAWSEAQSKLDLLKDRKAELDEEVAALQKQVDALQESVDTVAVNRYLGTGTTGIDLLTGNLGPTEQAQTAVLVGIVNEASASVMDEFAELAKQLESKGNVRETVEDLRAAQDEFELRQQEANDEVERLKLIEQDRLNDEAVLVALEAQRQKFIEAVERLAAEQLAKDQAAAALAAEGGGSDGGDEGAGVMSDNSASSGSGGGTTGGGGSGGRSSIRLSTVIYGQGEAWVCPIQGVTAFGDTWGAPRSGGRSHEGVDMISPKGTAIVAVVDGEAVARTTTLGGNVLSFYGADGNRYFYGHLDSYGALGPVVKGTVIGYVGDTGNAQQSIAHLHFEIHPGGGPAVNPYPTVLANC